MTEPDHRHVADGGDDSIGYFRRAVDAAMAVRAVNALRDDQDAERL